MVVTRDFLGLGPSAMIHANSGSDKGDGIEGGCGGGGGGGGDGGGGGGGAAAAAREGAAEGRYGEFGSHPQPHLAPPWIGSVAASAANGSLRPSGNSTNAAVAGLNDPMWNMKVSTFQQFMALRSSLEEKFMEGSADSQCVHLPDAASRPHGSSHTSYPKQNGGQLTIFYAGSISVYEDVPLEKAQTIMNMAANRNATWPTDMNGLVLDSSTAHPFSTHVIGNAEHMNFHGQMGHNHYNAAADQASRCSIPTNNHHHHQAECSTPSTPCSDSNPQLMVHRALPQARKASLARFLEKRKERMEMLSPYLKRHSPKLEQSTTLGGNINPIPESKFFTDFSNLYGLNSIVMHGIQLKNKAVV